MLGFFSLVKRKGLCLQFSRTMILTGRLKRHGLQVTEECRAIFARLPCVFAKNGMQSSQE